MFKFSESFRVERFKRHYSQLYPCEYNSKIKAMLTEGLSKVDLSKPVLILSSEDVMKQSFLMMFMREGFVSYKVMSAYSLLDIYLGNDEDMKSPLSVKADVLCFYLGYGEFENKRQGEVLIQVANSQLIENKKFWLFARMNESAFRSRYPDVYNFYKSSGYSIVTLGRGAQGGGYNDI